MAEAEVKAPKINLKKLPAWIWVAGAGGAIILVYVIIRNNANASAPASGGGGDAISALSGFTQQLDQMKSGLQAQIDALSKDQQLAVKQLADSINTSITSITATLSDLTRGQNILTQGQATLTAELAKLRNEFAAGITTLQQAIAATNQQVASVLSQVTANKQDAGLKFSAVHQMIVDLQDQVNATIRASTTLSGGSAIGQAFDNVRVAIANMKSIDNNGNFNGNAMAAWMGRNIDQTIAYLRANPTFMSDSPYAKLLLSLQKDAQGIWTLPAVNIVPGVVKSLPPDMIPLPVAQHP